ncbi:MAG: PepSY domain-containing protein [Verrucomicrobiae bacterium]|nr:PepSY domain-containing protein [Verrucomicrobiae bacterium]
MNTNTYVRLVAAASLLMAAVPIVSASEETPAELKAQAKIPQARAEKAALRLVPDGKIKSAELEKEHGKLVWSFDISERDSRNVTEVQVDARTGKIVSKKIETPKAEAKEAAAEQKEGK